MTLNILHRKNQTRLLSKTWRATLNAREIEKLKFQETGDIRKARELTQLTMNEIQPAQQVVIYSKGDLATGYQHYSSSRA